jgi:hypothetical protein
MTEGQLSPQEESMFRILEEELWQEESRFDLGRMEELIATDFFEYGGSGNIHNREATLSVEPWLIKVELPLPGSKARRLAADVVQITYDSVVEKDEIVQHRHRSSIWTRSTAGWVIRFHQDTPFSP